MRSELDVLLDKINDPILRAAIRSQVEGVRAKRTFGLVFESHLPERVRLPEHPIRVGVKVAYRDDSKSPTFEVLAVTRKAAKLRKVRDADGQLIPSGARNDQESSDKASLVVIADFGEPIFPGLRSLGSIDRGGNKPAHVVIKGENHHVLQALQFTHASKVDCIYIDPPYNTGARDWKYDNNYVDETDAYRHSKWLAFMERRLLLAKQLLNPEGSVLIVAVDEKEYLRLGLLLEQMFVGNTVQMITTVIKPEGTGRANEFSRTNEFFFIVMIGGATICTSSDNMYDRDGAQGGEAIEWRNLRRRERTSFRGSRPNQFYVPNGVFAPYTSIPTNLLFFDRSAPTQEVWYYEHPLPEGRKNYTKTAPMQFEEFKDCLAWWRNREENDRAWKVPAAELLADGCNLDRKNPRSLVDIAHLPPEKLAESVLKKERRIAEIMVGIQVLLRESGS